MWNQGSTLNHSVVVDSTTKTIYVSGEMSVSVPEGWTITDLKNYVFTPAIRMALLLRNCRFMEDVNMKIRGIKMIRGACQQGKMDVDLYTAKKAWEDVFAMQDNLAYQLYLEMLNHSS